MNWIFHAVKGIVYFLLFSSILEQIVWDTKMEKYIRFFTGLLLCMVLVNTVNKGIDSKVWNQEIENWYKNDVDLQEDFQMQEKKVQEKIENYPKENILKDNSQKEEEEGETIQIDPIEKIQ